MDREGVIDDDRRLKRKVNYPIGQQDFRMLRSRDCIYVDKTRFIADIVDSGSQYYFLARPRRFGKSLFLSTLRYFFEGKRELFKGLYIDSTNWSWETYPVLHIDLNKRRYEESNGLELTLNNLFVAWEKEYDVKMVAPDYSSRFENIIKAAYEKTGKPVVILVDEYDKPLVANLNHEDSFNHYRKQLASIYSNFKSSAEYIRLLFITGVSRFSKLSVFSDLNNLDDITFSNEYADICGITEKELLDNFHTGIDKLAHSEGISYVETCKILKDHYDGYRFAESGSEIYNPWSLLNALDRSKIANYWSQTGKPTIIAEALKRVNANLEESFNKQCTLDELQGMDLIDIRPTALLYQAGYLTIKDYNSRRQKYRLGIPNKEIKSGLFNDLLPYYQKKDRIYVNDTVSEIVDGFLDGEPKAAMKAMETYFAGVDYALRIENENNFHNAFFLLTSLIGLDAVAESHTSEGRIDIEIKTDSYIYIIELKYDHTAEEALAQIRERRYDRKYQLDGRKLYLIGASFSSKTRCIESWLIE